VSTLAPGEVRLKVGDGQGDWESFSVSGGYVQVHEDKVLVLADRALALGQIDKARASESKAAIERRLAELPLEAEDEREQCVRDLNWCDIQIKAVEKHGS
jgi:F-type H+-transporting ATPase subunit epsilon